MRKATAVLIARGLAVLALIVGLAACASAPRGGGAGGVAVRVENNLIPPTTLTVWAHPQVGVRSMVGVIQPSTTKTLYFEPSSVAGQYVFVAETTTGQAIRSNPVGLSGPGGTVVWDVSANLATVR